MRTFCLHITDSAGDGYGVAICREFCRGRDAERVGAIPAELEAIRGREPLAAAREAVLGTGDRRVSVDDVGRSLFRLLDRAGAASEWVAELDSDIPVRTLLHIEAGKLAKLPWEALTRDDGVRPFRSTTRPCLRVDRGPLRGLPPIALPVRVLVVVADRRTDAGDLQPDEEIDALIRSVAHVPGQWHVDVVEEPSDQELPDAMRRIAPHVLHVIAHGTREVDGPERPGLAVYSTKKRSEWVLTSEFVADNVRERGLRLAVLNSCRTSALDEHQEDELLVVRDMAAAFALHRSAAVVAMHGDLRSTAAARFTATLYADLANSRPIDVAVAAGRAALGASEWALPSLTVTADPADVFRPARVPQLPPWYPDGNASLREVSRLVDHGEVRRRVWQALDPDDAAVTPPARLVLLHGAEPGVGTGGVLRSALLTCRLRGRAVALAALGERNRRFEDVLRVMRDAVTTQFDDEVTALPVRRFDHALAHLADGMRPPRVADDELRHDDRRPFRAETERYDELVADAFAAFRVMLAEMAQVQPLTLGVHRLSAVVPGHAPFIVEHLLRPLVDGDPANVQLVLADTRGTLPADVQALATPVEEVLGFAKAELPRLVREYCARRGDPFDDAWRAEIETAKSRITRDRWKPHVLTKIRGYVYLEDDE